MIFEDDDALDTGTLRYQKVLRVLRERDPSLYDFVLHNIPQQRWEPLMAELKEKKPEVFDRLQKVVEALVDGQPSIRNSPETGIFDAAWEVAQGIKDTYLCDVGFSDVPLPQKTAVVYLKLPNVVMGLPKDVISLSNSLAKDYGGVRKWTFGFDNRMFVVDLEDAAIEELRKSPLVDAVDIPPLARILSNELPAYNPSGANTDWGVSRLNPDHAWNLGNFGMSMTGRKIKVCVIDTGIMSAHQAFWKDGICVFKGGYNFVSGGPNPADDHDHGTYCCSIVAGQHSGLAGSYRGVAPEIDLYACKALDSKGSGSFANIAAAVDWCRTNGMDIISMSLGGSSSASALETACNNAWYAGLLIIAAAGNSGPGPNTVNYPGKYQSCVAVAAIDFNELVASFSSRGPEVEVSAPGKYITGALAGFTYKSYAVPGSGEKYMTASGTSAACPHVAAGAALLKAWYPSMTNSEMRQWLRDHARDL